MVYMCLGQWFTNGIKGLIMTGLISIKCINTVTLWYFGPALVSDPLPNFGRGICDQQNYEMSFTYKCVGLKKTFYKNKLYALIV